MTWRPMIFTAHSVLGLLEDRKSQTRRIAKQPPASDNGQRFDWTRVERIGKWFALQSDSPAAPAMSHQRPRWYEGDHIWVKEGLWRDSREQKGSAYEAVIYQATPEWAMYRHQSPTPYRSTFPTTPLDGVLPTRKESEANLMASKFWRRQSPLFCPRWASRIFLLVTDVQLVRLQSITEADAIAEGAVVNPGMEGMGYSPVLRCWHPIGSKHIGGDGRPVWLLNNSPIAEYAKTWDRLNGKTDPWVSNPWVWKYTFTREVKNG